MPVLTKVKLSSLSDVSEGDHIMTVAPFQGSSSPKSLKHLETRLIKTDTQHFLVASTDREQNTYTGYTCEGGKAVRKVCSWDPNAYNICIRYEDSLSSREALANAEREIEQVDKWSDSDTFVTKMKTGRKLSFNDCCLFCEKNEFSSTQVTPEIAVDEGDHLVVKDVEGICESVLVLKHTEGSEFIVMPDITSEEPYGTLDITDYGEVYRINYKQSLPVDTAFQRAMSERGREILQACRGESSKFISWAKTGKKELIDVLQLDKKIAQLCPLLCEKISCIDEIKVGDHLIQAYPGHWWHFMITKVHKSDPPKFDTIYVSYRNHIKETEEPLVPTKDDIYRIVYPESLPVATAIERARSKIHEVKLSPLARMWFIRWAKTGSDEGIEVEFLFNNAKPATKSRICAFTQLNPGDYLVEKENIFTFLGNHIVTKMHHYLVTEVHSPIHCSAIGSESWKIAESGLTFNKKNTYYRLNYNDGACNSSEQAIAKARKFDGQEFYFHIESEYKHRGFVNYVKTGNATAIEVDSLQDDRVLLHRERIESTLQLRPGDHIERPLEIPLPFGPAYHHMMVVETPTDEQKCKVIHFTGPVHIIKACPLEQEIDIAKEGDNFFRIKYPERLQPDKGIKDLRECVQVILNCYVHVIGRPDQR